jgi:putative transposase
MELVDELRFPVETACRLMGIHKSTFYRYRARMKSGAPHPRRCFRQDGIRNQVHVFCQTHPTYGYRRIWALLRRNGVHANPKTVYRVMKKEGLLQPSKRYDAKRTFRKWDLPVSGSNQVWHIDLTKIWTDEGWVYLFSVVDAYDRRVVAWDLSRFCRDDEAIHVLEEAVNVAFPYGVRDSGLKLVQDNGSQFTSRDFVQTLKTLGITPIRTSYRHPQSNGKMERWYRTLKEEEVWPNEYRTLEEACASIGQYIHFYNYERVHSSLGYLTPMEVYSGELSTHVA